MKSSTCFRWFVISLWVLAIIALTSLFDSHLNPSNAETLASDNPMSGDEEAITAGRKTYNTFCAQCHGVEADGIAPRFGKYSADLRKFNKGFFEFAGIVVAGRPEKQMPPWGDYLDGEQISEIGAYLETLAIDGAKWAVEE